MLNDTQLVTLRAAIDADPVLVQAISAGSINVVVNAFNALASPAFRVWRSDVRQSEIASAFVWTEIDALTNGKARIWEWMRLSETLNCGIANIRQGLNDAFASAANTKAAVLAVIKRDAKRGEKLFATGTGSEGSPGTLVFIGQITDSDVEKAMRL